MTKNVFNIFIFTLLISFSSCATISQVSDFNLLGLYKIEKRQCDGFKEEKLDCESTLFIEFTKGNFYKISDDEVGFIIWRNSTDRNLLYTARKYENDLGDKSSSRVNINENEYLIFTDNNSGQYFSNNSRFNFIRVDKTKVTEHIMQYPGNF